MSRGKWMGRWFKVFDNFDEVDEDGKPLFWTGTVDNDELGSWFRLMALGSRCKPKAHFQISGIALTSEQISKVIKTGSPYIEKWLKQGALKIKNGVIYIANWSLYQNEQDRKDSYKDHLNRPPKQTGRDVDRDVDVVKDKDVVQKTNTKTKDTRVKKLIDYFFSAHLNSKDEHGNSRGKVKINGGKDGEIFKRLLETFTQEEIQQRIDWFMTWQDDWMKGKQRDVGMFSSMFNRYKAAESSAPKFMPKEAM